MRPDNRSRPISSFRHAGTAFAALIALAACGRAKDDASRTIGKPDSTAVVDNFARPGGDDASDAASADSTTRGAASASPPVASASGAIVPMVPGLTLTSALHFPDGDRENRIEIRSISPEGVRYLWKFDEVHGRAGDTARMSLHRLVSPNDLAGAPRLNAVFFASGPSRDLLTDENEESPGYTAFTISRAVYARLLASGETPYTVTNLESGPGPAGALVPARLTYRGTLTLVSRAPESLPILVNGKRTRLPVLHLHGAYALQEKRLAQDYWVLADSTHPLLLRTVDGSDVYQTIRIDLPVETKKQAEIDEEQLGKSCRMELPGVYFAFNSAVLETASEPAIAGVTTLLARHPDWSLTVEGHTDSVGNLQSNQRLSVARAESVRAALVQHGVAATRLSAAGYGASSPRESNATLEGRARNRRVELVRACSGTH